MADTDHKINEGFIRGGGNERTDHLNDGDLDPNQNAKH
jgi:hypothetical protein